MLWYRFDEAKGDVAVDSSGNSRNGTIVPITTEWTTVQDGGAGMTASLDTATPLNGQLTRSLRLDITSAGAGQRAGLANSGYFGVPVAGGRAYRVSFFAKASAPLAGPTSLATPSTSAQTGMERNRHEELAYQLAVATGAPARPAAAACCSATIDSRAAGFSSRSSTRPERRLPAHLAGPARLAHPRYSGPGPDGRQHARRLGRGDAAGPRWGSYAPSAPASRYRGHLPSRAP